ncbi:MAG: hypothetical protein ACK5JF_08570 [Oscillospiraceae bacterium]
MADLLESKMGIKVFKGLDSRALSPFVNYAEHYFIFDDLERCSMPINEVLGFVNHFLEQNNAKVLIIANESEIGSVKLISDNQLKYLVAAQDGIAWPEYKPGILRNVQNGRQKKPDLDEIKNRSELLAEKDTFYLQVKEKLIGQTIVYRPTLSNVVPVLFEKILSGIPYIRDSKEQYIEVICKAMNQANHFNLRTLQFSLLFFLKISDNYPRKIDKNIRDKMSLTLLEAVLKVAITYKNGSPAYKLNKDSELGQISLSNIFSLSNYFISFKFIHDYIYYGIYDSQKIKNILVAYCKEFVRQEAHLNDPTNILRYYWEMEDDNIEKQLNTLFLNFCAGQYEGNSYRWILSLLYKLKGFGFETKPIDEYVEMMKKNIISGISIETMEESIIVENDKYVEEYQATLKELQDLEKKSKKQEKEDTINTIFDHGVGWGEAFSSYCGKIKDAILIGRGFFQHIDVEKCFDAINRSSVRDLSEFRRSVASVYYVSNISEYYAGDIENIELLLARLDKTYNVKMKQHNIDLLRESLTSILEELKNN